MRLPENLSSDCEFGKRMLDFSLGDPGFLESWKNHLKNCDACSQVVRKGSE